MSLERDSDPKLGAPCQVLNSTKKSVVVIPLTCQASADAPADGEGEGGEGRLQSEQVMFHTSCKDTDIYIYISEAESAQVNLLIAY